MPFGVACPARGGRARHRAKHPRAAHIQPNSPLPLTFCIPSMRFNGLPIRHELVLRLKLDAARSGGGSLPAAAAADRNVALRSPGPNTVPRSGAAKVRATCHRFAAA